MSAIGEGVSRTRGSLLLIGARMLNAGFNLVSVPVFLAVLGEPAYGAVLFALSIQGIVALSDFGSGEVIQRQMSTALARGDREEVWELNRDQLGINLGTGALLFSISLVLGVTVSLQRGGIGPVESFIMFAAFGTQAMLGRFTQGLSIVLGTFRKFDSLSVAWTVGGFCVTAFALVGVFVTRRAAAYPLATVVSELVMMGVMAAYARRIPDWRIPKPAFRWHRIKPLFGYFATEYPNRVATFLPTVADKFLLGTATLVHLVSYRNASRLPDVLRDMLAPVASTSLPALSGEYQTHPEKFRANALFSGTTVFFAACVLMIVPSGFALPLLGLWLGRFAPPQGETVMILMSIYQAFQLYLLLIGYVLFAAGKRQLFIPLSAGGALVSLLATLPLYYKFGIVGLAAMNASISLVQCLGAWAILTRIGFSGREIGIQVGRISGILAVGFAFVAAGVSLSHSPLLQSRPILSLVFAPTLMLLTIGVVVGLRLSPLPGSLTNRLRKLGLGRKAL